MSNYFGELLSYLSIVKDVLHISKSKDSQIQKENLDKEIEEIKNLANFSHVNDFHEKKETHHWNLSSLKRFVGALDRQHVLSRTVEQAKKDKPLGESLAKKYKGLKAETALKGLENGGASSSRTRLENGKILRDIVFPRKNLKVFKDDAVNILAHETGHTLDPLTEKGTDSVVTMLQAERNANSNAVNKIIPRYSNSKEKDIANFKRSSTKAYSSYLNSAKTALAETSDKVKKETLDKIHTLDGMPIEKLFMDPNIARRVIKGARKSDKVYDKLFRKFHYENQDILKKKAWEI